MGILTVSLFWFFRVIELACFAYCILSWIIPNSRIFQALGQFIEPLTRPFRPLSNWIMERTGLPIDFSLLFLLLAIDALRAILFRFVL